MALDVHNAATVVILLQLALRVCLALLSLSWHLFRTLRASFQSELLAEIFASRLPM